MFSAKTWVAAIVLTLAFSVSSGLACGCGGVPGETIEGLVAQAMNGSVAVFQGKVIGSEYRKGIFNEDGDSSVHKDGDPDYKTHVMKFKVELWWKGTLEPEIFLATGRTELADGRGTGNSCDYNFQEGENYLVFAHLDKRSNIFRNNPCSFTQPVKDGGATLKLLGEGTLPNKKDPK